MKFSGILHQTGNNTGIEVPADILQALGSKRAAVKVTVNGYTYRNTVGAMGGRALIPFSAEHRKASGINGGDAIEVILEKDEEPRSIDLPPDLTEALAAGSGMRAAFDALSASKRKAHVLSIEDAKTPDTRIKRIEKVVASLT